MYDSEERIVLLPTQGFRMTVNMKKTAVIGGDWREAMKLSWANGTSKESYGVHKWYKISNAISAMVQESKPIMVVEMKQAAEIHHYTSNQALGPRSRLTRMRAGLGSHSAQIRQSRS